MAQSYLASLLPGKEHLARLPDGGLLAKDVVIARSGPLEYLASELDIPGGAQRVTVWRDPKEISSRRFLASVEGATITDMHPSRFVDPQNYQIYARGHAQGARVGPTDANGNATTLADLFIHDAGLAEKVERGQVRDVSIGYNLDVVKDELGRWTQKNLRCNHVAVVEKGRCGSTKILDSAPVLDLAGMAALYLGRDIGSVKLPEHAALRMQAFDSHREETVMAENKWKCSCGNINHGEADDCAACGKAYDDQEDLVPIEQAMPQKATRDEALHWLQQIKPQVRRQGTDGAKRAWNHLYQMIRDGKNPDLALQDLRGQFSAGGRVAAADHAPKDAERSAEFVEMCSGYLGKDVREAAAARKRQCRDTAERVFDTETPTENFLRQVEEKREQMIAKWKY